MTGKHVGVLAAHCHLHSDIFEYFQIRHIWVLFGQTYLAGRMDREPLKALGV
jgi:hypothetical protein